VERVAVTLTNIQLFRSNDINELNRILWETIYNKGKPLHFGSTEEPKDAKEIMAIVQIHGKALKDLYDGKLPKGWKFKEGSQKIYIEMLKDPEKGEQPYTYGERLHNIPEWCGFEEDGIAYCGHMNQIESAKDELEFTIKEGIQSNRICLVIWIPSDISLENPPCFQWAQLRVSEKNKISLRILFRSHDYGNAYMANFGAIIRCFVDEVIKPAGGELEELICVSASAHIYDNDSDQIENLIGKKPSFIKRWAKA
jgi:thymidylate synthase